jgi:hypothetical protein
MSLKDFLRKKRSRIVKKWCDIVLETYPQESQSFFKKQKDRFANPVGQTISEGIASIYDELLEEGDSDKISLFLDNIIRVRAIQDFSPSQAIGFVFGLKRIIREQLKDEIQEGHIAEELAAFESRIDALGLLSFDIYSACRQKIADIKVDSMKRHSSTLLKMTGLVYELPETEGGSEEGEVNNG